VIVRRMRVKSGHPFHLAAGFISSSLTADRFPRCGSPVFPLLTLTSSRADARRKLVGAPNTCLTVNVDRQADEISERANARAKVGRGRKGETDAAFPAVLLKADRAESVTGVSCGNEKRERRNELMDWHWYRA